MSITVKVNDTKTFIVPCPATEMDTTALAIGLKQAAENGYRILTAETIEEGTQRDPYTTGFRITVSK